MISKEQLNSIYVVEDPWQYQSNPCDQFRKNQILYLIETLQSTYGPYANVLDIGAGEGWITKDYPIKHKYGYEAVDAAVARWPDGISRVTDFSIIESPNFDLVVASGVMYEHYDYQLFLNIIQKCARKHVIVTSIREWEVGAVDTIGRCIHSEEFKYREYTQGVKVYDVSST